MFKINLFICFFILSITAFAFTTDANVKINKWPLKGDFVIGNLYHTPLTIGQPYFHHGIDLVSKPGEPVYAINDGYAKLFFDSTAVERRTGVVITDRQGFSWVYLHLIPSSIPDKLDAFKKEPVYIKQGEQIGRISGIYYNYPHLHLELWKNNRVLNPFIYLPDIEDSSPPVIHKIILKQYEGDKIFFDEVKKYPVEVSGDIEILAQMYDYIPPSKYYLTPYEIGYSIEYLSFGESYEINHSIRFDFLPGIYKVRPMSGYKVDPLIVEIEGDIYKVFNFVGKYKTSNFFYNLNKRRYFYRLTTRTDKFVPSWDSDAIDKKGKSKFPNGEYLITVFAKDFYGNETKKTVTVLLKNN